MSEETVPAQLDADGNLIFMITDQDVITQAGPGANFLDLLDTAERMNAAIRETNSDTDRASKIVVRYIYEAFNEFLLPLGNRNNPTYRSEVLGLVADELKAGSERLKEDGILSAEETKVRLAEYRGEN